MEKDAFLTAPGSNLIKARPSPKPHFQQTKRTRITQTTEQGTQESNADLSSNLTLPDDFRSKVFNLHVHAVGSSTGLCLKMGKNTKKCKE